MEGCRRRGQRAVDGGDRGPQRGKSVTEGTECYRGDRWLQSRERAVERRAILESSCKTIVLNIQKIAANDSI
jgi:hypothetical protein